MFLFRPNQTAQGGRGDRPEPGSRRVYALSVAPAEELQPDGAREPSRVRRGSPASWFFSEAIIRLCNGGKRLRADAEPETRDG
jgi:hypothetical protein